MVQGKNSFIKILRHYLVFSTMLTNTLKVQKQGWISLLTQENIKQQHQIILDSNYAFFPLPHTLLYLADILLKNE